MVVVFVDVGGEVAAGFIQELENLRGAFNLNFTFPLNQAGAVLHVPTKGAEEGIQEIIAQLRFGVAELFEFRKALAEGFDQAIQFPFKRFKGGGVRHSAEFAWEI